MAYKKLTAAGAFPEMWDFEEKEVLEGVYEGFREGVGRNNSNVYEFTHQTGEKVACWGNTVLDQYLPNLSKGSKVRITYLGLSISEKTGRKFKNFEIEVDE